MRRNSGNGSVNVAPFRWIVEAAQDAAVTMDREGVVHGWNGAATKLLGWNSDEAEGTALREFLASSEDRKRLQKELQAYQQLEETVFATTRFQTEALHRDGYDFPVELAIIPAPLEADVLFTAFIRDMRPPLEEAEERGRLAAIVESSTDAIIGRDLNGVITSWNASAERVYGYPAEEAIGQHSSLTIPEELTDEEPELQEVLTGGQTLQNFEVVRRRRNGELIDVSISISPIRNSKGEIVGSATIERDITRDRASHLALEEREEQIRMLLESTAEAIYGVDLDGNCTFCNPSCVKLLGYERPQQLIGRNMHELIHHHHADGSQYPAEECQIRESYRNNRGIHVDDEVLWRADGTCFPAEYWSFPMRRGNRICGAVVTFLDISERLAAERDRLRLAALVESSADAIIGLDLDGTIESWNDSAERVFGWTADEAVGKPVDLFLAPGRGDAAHEAITESRRISQKEVRCVRKDRREFIAALTLSPIRDLQDRHIGASIIARDISKRKQRERDLKEATTAAQAANRAKSDFLANISHELRTPMNAIIGMLELALGEKLSPMMQDYLGTAREAAQTLLYLLNDLLDFSRIEAGRFRLEPEPFSIRATLDHTAKTLSLRANEKGLELACRIAPDVPDVLEGDGMRLRQVVTNLVGNAIKFTEHGEITVEARIAGAAEVAATEAAIAERESKEALLPENAADAGSETRREKNRSTDRFPDDSGDSAAQTAVSTTASEQDRPKSTLLHFTVSDTGVGISEENQKLIFAPFTQVDTSSTRRYQGSGLGLTICRELVERMGGRVFLESEPGQGSRFHFTVRFPVIRARRPDEKELRLTVARLRDTRVLVVDDNTSNCRILDETLRQWQMRPFIASRGDMALDELRRAASTGDSYPVVLVDALMPDMDGFMLIEQALRENLLGDSALLMLSSADRQTFHERCEQVGITRYLEKPVSQSDLLDAVTRVLHGVGMAIEERTRLRSTSRPLQLLVAEDTPANQKVVRAILEKRGHSVTIATNGRQAIDQLWNSTFDLILMDVQMPVMDGYRATEAIRNFDDAARAAIPIIAMTAHAMREDRDRCLASGMNGYISKPLDAEQLIRLVEKTVHGSSSGAHPAPQVIRPDAEDRFSGNEPTSVRRGISNDRSFLADESSSMATARTPGNGDQAEATEGESFEEGLTDVWESEPMPPLLDRDRALARLGGDEEIFQDLMTCFIEDAPELLTQLDQAHREGRAEDFTRAAHSLKGLSANFEAVPCRDAAYAVEQLGRQNELKKADRAIAELRRQVDALTGVLTGG